MGALHDAPRSRRLSRAADMTPAEMATLSRELTELRPVCEQIELVNRLAAEIADAQMMVDEAGYTLRWRMARNELEESVSFPPSRISRSCCCCLRTRMICVMPF